MQKWKNIIKQAYISIVGSDDKPFPSSTLKTNGKDQNFVPLSVYGICSNPTKKSHVFVFSSQGRESNLFGIINDFLGRKKNLKEGEVVVHNSKTGTFAYFKEDGSIDIEAGTTINITAPDDVTIKAGDLIVENDILCDGEVFAKVQVGPIALSTHFSLGNLGFNTGTPIVNGLPGVPIPSPAPSMDGSNIVDGNGTKSTGHGHPYTWTDPAGSGTTGDAT